MNPYLMDMILSGMAEDEKFRRELAKQNYLNIHHKRSKNWRFA